MTPSFPAQRPRETGDQSCAPYLDALVAHRAARTSRVNVPSHQGGRFVDAGFSAAIGTPALELDLPPLIPGIDVGPKPTPLARAQSLAAQAWGAGRSFFIVGGASDAVRAAMLAVPQRHGRLLVQRSVHGSAVDGLVLSGHRPTFVAPAFDPDLHIAHCVTPEALQRELQRGPVDAVFVVSPTYHGVTADVGSLVEIAHGNGAPIIVDESWGAHLAFGSDGPPDALGCGADLVVSSTHKMGGSLGQSAILHLGAGGGIEEAGVVRALGLLGSTSPSALLLASLDGARRRLATVGAEEIATAAAAVRRLRVRLSAVAGVEVVDERYVGRHGIAGIDPLRLALDVRGTGRTGFALEAHLRGSGVDPEMATSTMVVSIVSPGAADRDLIPLAEAVEAFGGLPRGGDDIEALATPPGWGPLRMTPREAWFAPSVTVALTAAEGLVSAETIAVYPPGIPNVLPGEEFTAELIAYLTRVTDRGVAVRGASDPTLQTVKVAGPVR